MTKNPKLTVVASTSTGQPPPRKLGQHGLSLWHDVTSTYHIEDVGGIELLAQACAAADRAEALAAAIDADGETIKGKNGLRAHPCLKDELRHGVSSFAPSPGSASPPRASSRWAVPRPASE